MSQVTVYGAGWCHDTRNTRRQLDEMGVPYEYKDVDENPMAMEFVMEQNGGKRKLPTVEVGRQVLSIPDESELNEALRGQGIVQ